MPIGKRKFEDDTMMLAVDATPPGEDYREFAARRLPCAPVTVEEYVMRIRDPAAYEIYISRKRTNGRRYRGTLNKPMRATPVTPTRESILLALKIADGNAYGAARILKCSKTPVRRVIEEERAAGNEIGRPRVIRHELLIVHPGETCGGPWYFTNFRDRPDNYVDPTFNGAEVVLDERAPGRPVDPEENQRWLDAAREHFGEDFPEKLR